MLAAIARAGRRHDDPNLCFVDAKGLGHVFPDAERPLRAYPDRDALALPFRNRDARFERDVGQIRGRVRGLEPLRRAPERGVDVARLVLDGTLPPLGFDRMLAEVASQLLLG